MRYALLSPPAFSLFLILSGFAAGPGVATAWEEGVGDREACLATAVEAARRAGFRPGLSRDRQTVLGWRGEDRLAILCLGDREIAALFVYTREPQDRHPALEAVRAAFREGPPR